jgi:hypothetical protein
MEDNMTDRVITPDNIDYDERKKFLPQGPRVEHYLTPGTQDELDIISNTSFVRNRLEELLAIEFHRGVTKGYELGSMDLA